ncbi:hypothetical protein glysoja_040768 [Glycine soja]|uniref:Uncharacterized protein n=1 Tax=Glycine soja TaxID=3848 RepID=A0A0B2NSL2_GLYSO|nr:hypothetical protein glysoja_040768 [Glycine soja]
MSVDDLGALDSASVPSTPRATEVDPLSTSMLTEAPMLQY